MRKKYKVVSIDDDAWQMYFKHERYWLYDSELEANLKAEQYNRSFDDCNYQVAEATDEDLSFANMVESTILQLLERRYERLRNSYEITKGEDTVLHLISIFRDDLL